MHRWQNTVCLYCACMASDLCLWEPNKAPSSRVECSLLICNMQNGLFMAQHSAWCTRVRAEGEREVERWAENMQREMQGGKNAICVRICIYISVYIYMLVCVLLKLHTTSPNCSQRQPPFTQTWNECTISTWKAFLSNTILSALRFHAAFGFRGNCNNMKILKALPPVIQTTIAFPLYSGFQHGAFIYCRDDNKVLCCKGILYQCQNVLGKWSNDGPERFDSKAAINGDEIWYVILFNISKMVHKPLNLESFNNIRCHVSKSWHSHFLASLGFGRRSSLSMWVCNSASRFY